MSALSVIIPAYNSSHEIIPLLEALSAQTQDRSTVEYIIVNNNSQDDTRAVIEKFAKSVPINLRCIDENRIQGSYAARNAGIRAAQGKILIFTDADCIPDTDWVKNILPKFSDPQIGGVAGAIHAFPGDTLLEEFATQRQILSQVHTMNHEYMPFGQTANVAFRREVFQKIGLFRPGMKTAGDADMCWRMQLESDYRLALEETAIVHHRHRKTLKALYEQFERYGRSVIFLGKIYGWKPAREPRLPYYFRKLVVWAALRFPGLFFKYLKNKIPRVEVYREPLTLYIKWCSARGQKYAQKVVKDFAPEVERL